MGKVDRRQRVANAALAYIREHGDTAPFAEIAVALHGQKINYLLNSEFLKSVLDELVGKGELTRTQDYMETWFSIAKTR